MTARLKPQEKLISNDTAQKRQQVTAVNSRRASPDHSRSEVRNADLERVQKKTLIKKHVKMQKSNNVMSASKDSISSVRLDSGSISLERTKNLNS